MTEIFTNKGLWFTPEKPDIQIPGTLTFNPQDGIKLELIGKLNESRSSKDIHEPDFILGLTTDGKQITLYKCFETNRSMSFPGMHTSKYTANFVIKGSHFRSNSELVFNSVIGRFKNLDEWVSEYGFKKVETDFKTIETQIEYKLPRQIKFEITSELSGKINFVFSPPSSKYTNKIILEQKGELIIETKKAKPFEELLENVFHFQNFLTLGTFEASYPISLCLQNENLKEEIGKHKIPIKINVLFTHSTIIRSTRDKILWEFLFNYRDIAVNFSEIIKKWYKNFELIRPVTNLLFEGFYTPGKFDENRFLNISQAIETFHRRFRKNELLPNDQHKLKLKEILASVTPKYKDWLQGRLHFSNEPTLHMRLEELIKELTNKTIRKIIKDTETFIKDVKNSRNYYTHYDKSLEKKAKKGGDLFILTEKLKVILVCAVLKENGFGEMQIEALLERNEWKFFNHILE